MKYFTRILFFTIIFYSTICIADVLIIDRIKQEQSIDMPSRGLSMTQVISSFGEPLERKAAIGQPPITEWKYENFSVYFEKNWVIDSVAYKANANEKGPKYINERD